jgi:hypothetical protein
MSHDKTQTKINFNAKKANWLLSEIEPFIADRPLSWPHVSKLVSEMRQGHFMPEITTIMVANLNGTIFRLNGQHTATAVLEMAKEDAEFSLSGVTLITFTVSDEAELRRLYARIDRGAARTNRDVTISLLSGTADFATVSQRVLKLLPLGLAFMKFDESNRRKLYAGETAALDVQDDLLVLSKKIAIFMDSLDYKSIHHGHMFRGPVVAALYATFMVDEEDAEQFWRAVATGVGFESEAEPAARLRQMLKNISVGGGMTERGKNRLSSEEVYRVCLHAWNRFREGATFQQALRPTVLKSRPKVK